MLTKRIIPCLDIKDGKVVKGVNFVGLKDVGDPIELAKKYDVQCADEVVFLDITASYEDRGIMKDIIERGASELTIPLAVGGGIRTLDDFRMILASGADKVSVNSAAIVNPQLIKEAADEFGVQCVVIAIDAKKREDQSGWDVYVKGGRENTGLDLIEWVKKCESLGAGEVLLTSMDADGTKAGYDIEMLNAVCKAVDIPVIASGGCGSIQDIIDVFGDHEFILNTLAKDNTTNTEEALIEIYNKLRPGEPATLEGATSLLYTRFFDPKRYDLAKAGRFKFKKKLSLLDRIAGRVLAEDVKDVDGNVVCTKGTVITNEVIDTLRPVFEAGAHTVEMKTNPRLESNGVLQVVHVYVDESRTKVMKVIGTDLSLNCKYVTISDMIAAYSYMLNLVDIFNSYDLAPEDRVSHMARIGLLDDIDHLN